MTDPVRLTRRRWKRFATTAKRAGYLCLLASLAVAGLGVATSFESWVALSATALFMVGAALLLPAVIVGYAVNAAEREDRARGR